MLLMRPCHVGCLLTALLCGATLLGQSNPRELVRQSIANGEKAWKQSRTYVTAQFNAAGKVKSTDRDLYRIIPIQDDAFEEHIEHNSRPLTGEPKQKQQLERQKREHETPRQRTARRVREERERSYYKEIPDAFDFKMIGEQKLPTGPAWIFEATPQPWVSSPQPLWSSLSQNARQTLGASASQSQREDLFLPSSF